MATVWRSHQVCEKCGWAGVTKAHRSTLVSGLLYAVAAIVAVILEALAVVDLQRVITWPVAAVALFWFFGVPALLWRTNACGGCGQRMAVKLQSGRAASVAQPGAGTDDGPTPRS
jgi:hypothetical protein